MSTRSAIVMKEAAGYRGIYCHSDGYPEGVGKTLLDHYQDADKVKRLIDLGSLSCLGKLVDPVGKHSFDNRERDVTVAYGRDRGEKNVDAVKADHLLAVADMIDHQYVYVFEDGAWTCNGVPLTEIL